MPKIFSAYERSSLCEAGRSPESNAFLTDIMNTDPKQTNRNARKSETPSYKYSFWFNEEHIRFKKLLCKSGLEHNRSQFIVKRIFGEEFVVIKRDPSKTQFIARLNDFYFQFQKLGNNYNQIVKAVNSHFSNVAIPHQIAMLEQRTRELKAPLVSFRVLPSAGRPRFFFISFISFVICFFFFVRTSFIPKSATGGSGFTLPATAGRWGARVFGNPET